MSVADDLRPANSSRFGITPSVVGVFQMTAMDCCQPNRHQTQQVEVVARGKPPKVKPAIMELSARCHSEVIQRCKELSGVETNCLVIR